MRSVDTLIVGGGHAGAAAAAALRQSGYDGTVAFVSAEPELPYERPPLSKDYLAGDKPFERLLIRPRSFWEDRSIEPWLGETVTAVDPAAHQVATAAGEMIGYRTMIWAAGGDARRLSCSGHDLTGVHTVRSRSDVDRMVGELAGTRRVVVIGGGYIGLEAAAVLTKLRKQVCLIEALDRVLARVAGETLSRFYEAEHRAHGVDVRLGAAVDSIVGDGGRVTGVRLAGGELIECEMVVVGIGVVPAVAPLLDAGAAGGNGVDVDAQCRTSLADVFAIGDCARHANRFADGAMVRLESVQNANDQALVAAQVLRGREAQYAAVPWFWSNQYDLKLQTVGLSTGHDRAITRGDPFTRSFSVIYLRNDRVVAVDCVNAVKDFVQARKLVVEQVAADPVRLADSSLPLKDLTN